MSTVKYLWPFGLTLYCCNYGNVKFESMVDCLNRMHRKYPNALIVTDFDYKYATHTFKRCNDFLDIRNGENGVIFAFKDIDNLLNLNDDSCFSELLLSELLQQRRLHIKIVAVSNGYCRLPRFIRELCFTVVYCKRLFARFIYTCEYDAFDCEDLVMERKRILKRRLILRNKTLSFPGAMLQEKMCYKLKGEF